MTMMSLDILDMTPPWKSHGGCQDDDDAADDAAVTIKCDVSITNHDAVWCSCDKATALQVLATTRLLDVSGMTHRMLPANPRYTTPGDVCNRWGGRPTRGAYPRARFRPCRPYCISRQLRRHQRFRRWYKRLRPKGRLDSCTRFSKHGRYCPDGLSRYKYGLGRQCLRFRPHGQLQPVPADGRTSADVVATATDGLYPREP